MAKMSDDEQELLQKVAHQVSQLHTHVLGVEGQGGLTRDVKGLREEVRVETEFIRAEVSKLKSFKSRVLGASAVIAIVAAWAKDFVFGK